MCDVKLSAVKRKKLGYFGARKRLLSTVGGKNDGEREGFTNERDYKCLPILSWLSGWGRFNDGGNFKGFPFFSPFSLSSYPDAASTPPASPS